MKITAISRNAVNNTGSKSNRNNTRCSVPNQGATLTSDKFISQVNFNGYGMWYGGDINPFVREADDLGEYFFKSTDSTIKDAAHTFREDSQRVYSKITTGVSIVKNRILRLNSELFNCTESRRIEINKEIERINQKADNMESEFRKWNDDPSYRPDNDNPFSWDNIQY